LIEIIKTIGSPKMLNVMREQINPAPQQIRPLPYDVVALVLQGGGALGAYQAGVYEGLHEAGIRPNWLAGISIGALNAAIIAGSPEGERVQRLREFWETICAFSIEWPAGEGLANALPFAFDINSVRNAMAATRALVQGQPGFFKPRFPSPLWSPFSGDAATSFYDTAPLQQTLERLVDFDRLNSGEMRVSVGAVNVRTGNLIFRHRRTSAGTEAFHGFRRPAAGIPRRRNRRRALLGWRRRFEHASFPRAVRRAARHPDVPDRSLVGDGPRSLRPDGSVEPAEGHSIFEPHARHYRSHDADAEDASGVAADDGEIAGKRKE
jgi:hypothetical protein